MIEISASILSVQEEKSLKTFYNLETAGIDYFHIDVMDGKFVENNTEDIMRKYAMEIKHVSNIPLDVHLMVKNVRKYIDEYLDLQPKIITIHYESGKNNILENIRYVNENNIKSGISIKPNTEIEEIYEILPYIHQVLIMTVEPGQGGQKLIESTLEKIKKLKQYIKEKDLEIDIEVDGGINLNNIEKIKRIGADIVVCGTALINSEDYKETVRKMKQ